VSLFQKIKSLDDICKYKHETNIQIVKRTEKKYKQIENSNKSKKYEQIYKLTLQQEKLSFKI
jgi:hypothetical protein